MTLTTQFITILSMIGGGMYVGASLDTFERFFYKRNKRSWLEFFYQIGFWLFQAIFLFFILYQANYGELRIYVFMALLCGFAAYRALFQNIYLKMLEICIRVMTAIIKTVKKIIYHFVIWPIKTIVFLIFSLLIGVYKILLKGIFLMFLVVFYPIKFLFLLIWRLLPKNMKNYLRHLAGFLDKIKNTMNSWKKRFHK